MLLKEDITRLRQYINGKFPHYDNNKRAQILINSVKSIIDQHMIGLPMEYRNAISDKLLKEVLISKSDGLFLYDIFEASLSLKAEDSSFSENLCLWVNRHISKPIDRIPIFESDNNETKTDELMINTNDALTPPLQTLEPPEFNLNSQQKPKIYEIEKHNKGDNTFTYSPAVKKVVEKNKIKLLLLASLVIFALYGLYGPILNYMQASEMELIEPIVYQYPHLPSNFYYKEIDLDKLKAYLDSRNSLLSQEPYFTSIIDTSREFELNPLILFAIAGHEQGFVPVNHPSAAKIVNNPFNVFVSWQSYNTDIVDSARIAARTIINLSKDRPEDTNPFLWINRKYAEDENWWKGIDSIYNRLEREVE